MKAFLHQFPHVIFIVFVSPFQFTNSSLRSKAEPPKNIRKPNTMLLVYSLQTLTQVPRSQTQAAPEGHGTRQSDPQRNPLEIWLATKIFAKRASGRTLRASPKRLRAKYKISARALRSACKEPWVVLVLLSQVIGRVRPDGGMYRMRARPNIEMLRPISWSDSNSRSTHRLETRKSEINDSGILITLDLEPFTCLFVPFRFECVTMIVEGWQETMLNYDIPCFKSVKLRCCIILS